MRLAPLLLPLLLLAAAPAPLPAMWKVSDPDTTVYLFGTMHVLPANTRWRGPALDRAVAQAGTLLVEVVLDDQPGRVAAVLGRIGMGKGLPPLAERVPPAKRAALTAMIKASGFPPATLDTMKTWAAGVVLTGAALGQLGLGSNVTGVEPELEASFRAAGKPVLGLETAEQQLGYFDRLPEASQRSFLVSTLDSPASQRRDFAELLAAWRSGNLPALQKSFDDDPEFTPALRDLIVRQRDRAWADAIVQRLKQPGTVLMAVGAGHLVGPDSVQAMLAARGVRAVRVQ